MHYGLYYYIQIDIIIKLEFLQILIQLISTFQNDAQTTNIVSKQPAFIHYY